MTPIRVVCNNTLNLALNTAKRQWSTRHVGDMDAKMQEARLCLELAGEYMDNLGAYAYKLANKTIYEEELNEILSELFPVEEDSSDRKKVTAQRAKDEFMVCYWRPDIAKFMNTAWGVVNAMSDMVTHSEPMRKTANYRENNWGRIMDGHKLLDQITSLVGARI